MIKNRQKWHKIWTTVTHLFLFLSKQIRHRWIHKFTLYDEILFISKGFVNFGPDFKQNDNPKNTNLSLSK